MNDEERRQYLSESLFLNFVSYENERLAAYCQTEARAGAGAQGKAVRNNEEAAESRGEEGKRAAAPGKAKGTR